MLKSFNHGKKVKPRFEQTVGVDFPYFARGTSFALLQHFFGLIAGLGTSYVFGHFITKSVFGEYNLILSILSLLTIFSLPGLDTSLTRSVAQGFESSLFRAVRLRFIFSFIGIPILFLLAFYYYRQGQLAIALTLLLSLPFFPFLYSFQSYQAKLVAKQQFGKIAVFASVSSILLALLIILAGITFPTTTALVFAYLIAIILPAMLGFFIANLNSSSVKRDPDLLPYGLFITLNSALAWIVGNLGNIILASILGVSELAIFSVASKLPGALQKAYATISKTVTAKIAGQNRRGQREIILHHWWKFIILGILMCVFLWMLSPLVLRFLFPSGYEDAITYTQWLSLIFIPMPLGWALSDVIIFQKQKKTQVVINTVPSILKIVAYFVFIPNWHTPGLVAIAIIDDFLVFLLYVLAFLRSS